MDDKLDSICKDFVSNITSFLDLIVSEIRSFKRTVKKYNVIAKNASFGSLNQIIIEIENDRQYDALRDFKNNLDNALNEGTLNAKIFDIINKGMFSLSEYFSREILNDPHARSRDFLDIYQYFDFEIYSQSEGIKRPALSSSGGESTGIKFLIYALAFHNLRSIEGYGDLTYQKPVFIYFDEAAAVDPSGIKTIIEISEKLKVNAIIAMVDAPAIHNKKVIDYIMANGVINTGYSDMIAEIESGKID